MSGLALVAALAAGLAVNAPASVESLSFRIVPRQRNPESCGLAVAAGLINLWRGAFGGVEAAGTVVASAGKAAGTTEAELRRKYGIGPEGDRVEPLSFADIIRVLAGEGLTAKPFSIASSEVYTLLEFNIPAILLVNNPLPHFVLGLRAESGFIVVGDPAFGSIAVSTEEFAEKYSGFALIPDFQRDGPLKDISGTLEAASEGIVLRRAFLGQVSAIGRRRGGSNSVSPAQPPQLFGEVGVGIAQQSSESDGGASPALSFSALAKLEALPWLTVKAEAEYPYGPIAGDSSEMVFLAFGIDAGPATRNWAVRGIAELGLGLPTSFLPAQKESPSLYEFSLGASAASVRDPVLLDASAKASLSYTPGPERLYGSIELGAAYLQAINADLAIRAELGEELMVSFFGASPIASRMRVGLTAFLPIGFCVLGLGSEFTLQRSLPFSGKFGLTLSF